MNNIKNWIGTGLILITFVGCFVEISKFKINPISFIFTRIGTAFNKPVLDRLELHEATQKAEMDAFNDALDKIMSKLEETDKKIDVNEIKRIRAQIMAFATSLSNRDEHNEEQFQEIIRLHDEYEKLIKATGLVNGVLDADYEYIMMIYSHCKSSGKFCKGACYTKTQGGIQNENQQQNV